jgi:ribose-phosphate pyrophosphokinase
VATRSEMIFISFKGFLRFVTAPGWLGNWQVLWRDGLFLTKLMQDLPLVPSYKSWPHAARRRSRTKLLREKSPWSVRSGPRDDWTAVRAALCRMGAPVFGLNDQHLLHYHCRSGRGYSIDGPVAMRSGISEEALWSALHRPADQIRRWLCTTPDPIEPEQGRGPREEAEAAGQMAGRPGKGISMHDDLLLFALSASASYGSRIADALGTALAPHEERSFEDGEHKARPLVSVRDRDIYVLQSLRSDDQASANDKLCRLLFFIGALKDAGAARVTAVVPYLAYARKDRKTQPRDPVTTRYVAALFEALGTDRILALEVHNLAAFQNAFRCQTDHLEATKPLAEAILTWCAGKEVMVVSPDAGGVKRAERLRAVLARQLGRPVGMAFVEKYRALGVVSGGSLVGEVSQATTIILDDLISTGTTMLRAAQACRAGGARHVLAAATHAAFSQEAGHVLADPSFDRIIVTDSIPLSSTLAGTLGERLATVSVVPLFAQAIRRLHDGGSIVELLGS